MLMVGINGIFLAEMLDRWYLPLISVFAFVAANVFPSVAKGGYPSFKFRMIAHGSDCLLYTSPSPRDRQKSRMPSSA